MRLKGTRLGFASFIGFVIAGLLIAARILTKPDSPLDGIWRVVVALSVFLIVMLIYLVPTYNELWWIDKEARDAL